MAKSKTRKIIAPVVITLLMALAVIAQLVGFLFATPYLPFWIGITVIALSLIFLALMVYVLIERIRDIKSGEEDDLDNY